MNLYSEGPAAGIWTLIKGIQGNRLPAEWLIAGPGMRDGDVITMAGFANVQYREICQRWGYEDTDEVALKVWWN